MSRCSSILTLIVVFIAVSCVSKRKSENLKIDVMKICNEGPKLVEKILPFSKGDFHITGDTDSKKGYEETWELGRFTATASGIEWLQLTFSGDQLQTIWFGPRKSFEEDMERLGLDLYFIKTPKGKPLESYRGGVYQAKDLSGGKILIEHDGAPVKGLQITCFPKKK